MTITPAELRDYSTFDAVKDRPDPQLKKDILEARVHIEGLIGKSLKDFLTLPEELELALLKVAQYFALINGDESIAKGYKSEKIGDYSYTLADGSTLSLPDVSGLLEDYMPADEAKAQGTFLRVRAL